MTEQPTKREVQALIMWARKHSKNGRWWSGGVNDRFARIVNELEEIKRML